MPEAASAARLLVAALDDPDEGVRANAGRGLAALGTTAVYGPIERTATEL
jgi:HEAT repeat protein